MNKVGVRFTQKSQQSDKITGRSFPVEFEIKDDQPQDVKGKVYNIKVCLDLIWLHKLCKYDLLLIVLIYAPYLNVEQIRMAGRLGSLV